MPQKKKTTNKKSHKKKHLNQNNQNIIFQSIPNYSSSQISGHQNNKNVSFAPAMQQQSRTDNLVGDLVGRLINKIENEKTQQTQDYTKEIQPINNSNSNGGNNSVVNIYSDGTKKEDKKQDETPTQTTESAPDSKISDLVSEGVKNAASNAVRDYAIAGVSTVLGLGGLGKAYKNRQSIGESISRYSTSARNSISRFSTSAGHRLGRGSEYNGLDRPPPVGAAFEEVSEARTRAGSRAGSRAVSEASSRVSTDLQTGSRGLDNAALDARMDDHVRRIMEQSRPIEVSRTIPRRPPSIADENAPLLIGQPPLSARSNSSRSSSASSSSTRNLIHESPAAVRRARNSTNPVLEAEITLAPSPRARVSGIHEHSGVSTRNIRAQTGEPHSQLSQTREYYRSDNPEYRKGQRHREKHDNTNRPRPLVEVLNPDSPYNQGYFGDALHEGKEGYHPREVKPGPKKK